MAACLGPEALLVEYGSGSSVKTRLLLDRLVRPSAYVPVDISREHLFETALALCGSTTRALAVLPVCADFSASFALPRPPRPAARRAVYFPGSTIGNFSEAGAIALMAGVARLVGPGGALLVGVDLKKDPRVLERAYDDAARRHRRLQPEPARAHEPRARRRLRPAPLRAPRALDRGGGPRRDAPRLAGGAGRRIDGAEIHFARGESICTEHSHKYTLAGFAAPRAPRRPRRAPRLDRPRARFSVQYLEVPARREP